MRVFTDAELEYLHDQKLGRLATVGDDGQPHVAAVGFRVNRETGTIDIGGLRMSKTKKFRDVQRTGRAAFIVDDVLPPWRPRGIEIRGTAETLGSGGTEISERMESSIIRITPRRIVSWGLNGESRGTARDVG